MSDPGASPERESSPTSEPERTRPSSASSTSTASGETERGQPTPIASSSTLTPSTDKQNDDSREADLSVTPTTSSNVQNPTTPPASSRPVAALSSASPAPTSSPTPNAHRRNHSAASASTSSSTGHPTSAFSSPARREQTSQHQHGGIGGDVNDDILHEESAEEEERHVGDGSGYFGSVQSTPATQTSSRSRQGTYAAVTSSTSRSRPPSAALNRRSISVNTQASTGSNPQSGPSNRRSAHHLSAPSSQQPLRTPTSHPLQGSASARPASRLDRPLTAMSGYEREYGSADEESADEDLVEREKERRRRAMSPAVGGRRRNGDDNEDDEVIPLDRGEQLVKRRARERKVRSMMHNRSEIVAVTDERERTLRRKSVVKRMPIWLESNSSNVASLQPFRLQDLIKQLSVNNKPIIHLTTTLPTLSTIPSVLVIPRKIQDLVFGILPLLDLNALKPTPYSAMVLLSSLQVLAVLRRIGHRCPCLSQLQEVVLALEHADQAMFRAQASAMLQQQPRRSVEKTKRGVSSKELNLNRRKTVRNLQEIKTKWRVRVRIRELRTGEMEEEMESIREMMRMMVKSNTPSKIVKT